MIQRKNDQQLLEQFKLKLQKLESDANKSLAQEEYLLTQLKENFDCDTLEETVEYLEDLIEEKDNYDKEIESKIEDIKHKMHEHGFI